MDDLEFSRVSLGGGRAGGGGAIHLSSRSGSRSGGASGAAGFAYITRNDRYDDEMRDPAIYRVRNAAHHRTGDKWHIYPMYTYAHPIEDALENITHSLCTLEFEDQRPFYDWLL